VLLEALYRYLADGEPRPRAKVASEVAGPDSLVDPLTLQALRDSLGEEGLASLVALFDGQVEARLETLAHALGEGELEDAQHAAHQLKGESASLGAVKVAGLATRLERLAQSGDREAARGLLGELRRCLEATRSALEAWRVPPSR